MKILAFNGSPNKDKGTTASILNPFLQGVSDAGGEYDLFHVRDLQILPCRECTGSPAFQSTGRCKCDDDMNALYPKFREADVWVFAAPNYLNAFPGQMKHLMDRLEPLFPSQYAEFDDTTLKVPEIHNKKLVMIATSTQWDSRGFTNMKSQLEALAMMFDSQLVAAITRPHAEAMLYDEHKVKTASDVERAARRAGSELVKSGFISTKTLQAISQTLISRNSFLNEVSERYVSRL